MTSGTSRGIVEGDSEGGPSKLSALAWAGLLFLGLVAWLYLRLFFPPSGQGIETESEQFFFEVNEAAGAPVLLLSFWLFYRRSHLRDELLGPGRPLAALVVWFLTGLLYGWALYTSALDLQLATLIGVLVGTLLMWGGTGALRAYWLPTVFLGFALPISPVLISAVIWPVQLATAEYAGWMLNAIGVPSMVQGDQILRPENTFIVIETCSGLRSVVTLTMLTILLIDLFERKGWHALMLILLAPVVALLTNGVRVVTLVLNPHSDIASIHSLQGIAMLLVGLTLIYGIDTGLARLLGSRNPAEETDYGSAREGSALTRSRKLALLSPALLLATMLGLRAFIDPYDPTRSLAAPIDRDVSAALEGWRSQRTSPDFKYRGSIHYRSWSRRRIEVDGRAVDLLVGIADPTNRKLTMYSPRFAQPDSGFEAIGQTRVPLVEGAPPARRVLFQRGARRLLSYSWYEPEPSFAEEFFRHALALDRSPFARTELPLAVRISTPLQRGELDAKAEARMARVYARIAPVLREIRARETLDE